MTACLLLGSNLGNREAFLSKARRLIEARCGKMIKWSKIRETAPWGFVAETPFLNQALLIETALSHLALLKQCMEIETSLGRVRFLGEERYNSRPIDIDILFYKDMVCETPELTLPHPRIHVRMFALEPLAEVAPDWEHPVLGITAEGFIALLEKT
jgi:2-amino-4-hydroxy-6-hydroxymethyldihydropteridine diphosphokinase